MLMYSLREVIPVTCFDANREVSSCLAVALLALLRCDEAVIYH
jgi:hypothetical protein